MKIGRVLISVYDKSGIVDFTRELEKLGMEIIATNGTFKILEESGICSVKKVSDTTQFPEMLDGRVKTEHPKIMGGILALRENEEHVNELKRFGISPIDIVVCNLYPFIKTFKLGVDLRSSFNSIDVGGPNMIRAAAKNFKNVVVIVSPRRYDQIINELSQKGNINMETRLSLAIEAFKMTASYDMTISKFLENKLSEFVEVFHS